MGLNDGELKEGWRDGEFKDGWRGLCMVKLGGGMEN